MSDEAGFARPAFDENVDFEAYLRDCPPGTITRGTFFEDVQKLMNDRMRMSGSVPRWSPFKTYPLRDFLQLCMRACPTVHPGIATGEVLRRFGRACYPSFADTMAGKVVLFAFGQKLEHVVQATTRTYAMALPGSRATVHQLGERHYRSELRDVYSFAETYHAGIIEGAVRAFGYEPQVLVKRGERRCDVDFDIRWSAT